MEKIQELRNSLERQKGERNKISKSLISLKSNLKFKKVFLRNHEKAIEIVRLVALKTQERLQFHISDLASLALDAVFDDPYQLKAEFVQRRNKTECDLFFLSGEYKVNPLEASGVGAVDVATFALRVASWSMTRPRSRNIIILDEPFRFLSEDHQERASLMLQEVSKIMKIQFIIVTHEEELALAADKTFKVTKNKITKRSKIKIL